MKTVMGTRAVPNVSDCQTHDRHTTGGQEAAITARASTSSKRRMHEHACVIPVLGAKSPAKVE